MLDTNVVGHFVRQTPAVVGGVTSLPMASLCISAITAGELRYGLANRPNTARLHRVVGEFLRRVVVLPWDDTVATVYGGLRAGMPASGKTLSPLDLLIAAHALAVDATLATNDGAFSHVPNLRVQRWAT